MRVSILLFGFSFLSGISDAGWHEADSYPKIETSYRVVLSSGMETALKRYDLEFRIWEAENLHPMLRGLYVYMPFEPWRPFLAYQTPSALIGDFNGDDLPDAVLLGRNRTQQKTIIILSRNDTYLVIEQDPGLLNDPLTPDYRRGEGNIQECLELVPPGKIPAEPAYDRPEIELKTDAFKLGNFEGAKSIYYLKDGKFVSYALSD